MSKENARAFLQRLIVDRTLVTRCKSASQSGRLRIAAEIGLPYTEDDMRSVLREGVNRARRDTSDELSEAELSHVTGGTLTLSAEIVHLLPTGEGATEWLTGTPLVITMG